MPVIELGHIDDGPAARRPARRSLAGDLRWLAAAALALLCVLTVTGSSAPGQLRSAPLWSLASWDASTNWALLGDTVYVLRTGSLTAYRARTGTVRWEVPQPAEQMWLSWSTPELLLVTTSGSPAGLEPELPLHTFGVDAATGRRLWEAPGEPTGPATGGAVLLAERTNQGHGRALRSVAALDGRMRWVRTSPAETGWPVVTGGGRGSDRIVTVAADGLAETVDTLGGQTVGRGRLPWRLAPGDQASTNIFAEEQTIYVESFAETGTRLSAYDTGTLRLRWETGSLGAVGSCGPVLCAYDFNGISAIDRTTGDRLWSRDGALNPYPLPGGRIVVDDRSEPPRALLDALTGRLITGLGRTTPVINIYTDTGTPYVIGATADPPGRTALSELDPVTGALTVRGVFDPVLNDTCQGLGNLVACATADRLLVVSARRS